MGRRNKHDPLLRPRNRKHLHHLPPPHHLLGALSVSFRTNHRTLFLTRLFLHSHHSDLPSDSPTVAGLTPLIVPLLTCPIL